MIVRIPETNFLATDLDTPECAYQGAPPLGEACGTFVVLYSEYGGDATYPNNDGNEEWGVELYEQPTAVTLTGLQAGAGTTPILAASLIGLSLLAAAGKRRRR